MDKRKGLHSAKGLLTQPDSSVRGLCQACGDRKSAGGFSVRGLKNWDRIGTNPGGGKI